MLSAVDLHEDFIDIESIAIAPVLSLQSPCVESAELDAPPADGISGYGDAPLDQ